MDEQLSTSRYLPPSAVVYDGLKRTFDVIAGVALLIAFSPILIITAVSVKCTSKGPIFYKQIRIGRYDRPFKVWKFRTMKCDADRVGPLITSSDDDRITRVGSYLRKNKLDELPQLWNVIIGDMSLVGPRPQVPRFVDRFPKDQRSIIMMVRPGITGPTQLEFRHEERMLQGKPNREDFYIQHLLPIKCQMDVDYVYMRSFILDLKVLLKTGGIVLMSVVRRILGRNGTPADEQSPVAIPTHHAVVHQGQVRPIQPRRVPSASENFDNAHEPSYEPPVFLEDKAEEVTAHSRP